MVEDAPDDLVHEVFAQQFWPKHPLGRPILGTPETVTSFESGGLREYFGRTYVAPNLLVAAAGQPRARAAARSGRTRVRDLPRRRRADATRAAGRDARASRSGRRTSSRATSASARRPIRQAHDDRHALLRAQHDSRRLDELAAVPAHPRRARAGLRGLQQPHDVQRRRHDDDLRRLRDRQGRRGRRPDARRAARAARRRPCPPTSCGARRITSRAA